MKSNKKAAIVLATIALVWSSAVLSQEQPPPRLVPIDAYMCNYNDGQDRADLDKVAAKWNQWADENDFAAYNAWLMTPVLASINMPVDVVWLGAWANGKEMGDGMQTWLDKGRPLQAQFDKVIDCGEHSIAASLNIRPPGSDWPGESGVATFRNCTVAEGKTIQDALAAHRAFAKYLDSRDAKVGMWVFFPGAGNNNPEWDYKLVNSHSDFRAWGAGWEGFTNGGGYMKAMEIHRGIIDCDSPRVYHSTTVRNANINPAP